MTTAARATLTGVASSTGIKTELQALAMNIISQVFHSVRKAVGICLNEAKRVAFYLPAVINNNILVSRILHTRLYHLIRHIHNQLFADITTKLIPGVPSHRRSLSLSQISRIRNYLWLTKEHLTICRLRHSNR